MLAEELQRTRPISGTELVQEQAAEQFREHGHRQQEERPARDPPACIEREAAARHDHVHMRVVGQCRAPGVQDGQDADASAEMLGIGGDGEHGLGRGLEQQIVDHRLVLIGDVGDPSGQREHHVEIRYRQKLRLALGQPFPCRCGLALRAVPVAAGVIGDDGVSTVLAALDMATERRRAAALDRRHHLQLVEADVTGIGRTPAAPWSRKISATSSFGRSIAAGDTPAADLPCGSSQLSWASPLRAPGGRAGSRRRRSCRWRRGYSAPSSRVYCDRAVVSYNAPRLNSLKVKDLLRGIRC